MRISTVFLPVLACLIGCISPLHAQSTVPAPSVTAPSRVSPHETISVHLGSGRGGPLVTVTYGRPYSKDPKTAAIRKIWGTLVPWEKAWRLGSDEATTLMTQVPLKIGNATIPAGVYTLYLVPSEKGVTKLAFSNALGKWGIPVDEGHDLLRVDTKKDTLDKQIDQLTLTLTSNPTGGALNIAWETTQYSVAIVAAK